MRKIFYLFILICAKSIVFAQHPYFASLNQSYLSLNPAFAGSNEQLRIQSIGALQNVSTNFQNFNSYAGADMLFKKIKSGIGLSYQSNNYMGLLNKSQFDFSYAYHITVKNKLKIVPAIQVSYFEVMQNNSNTSYRDMIDPRRGFIWNTNEAASTGHRTNVSLSPGLLIYNRGFFIGASLLDANKPDEGLKGISPRPMTQVYNGGARLNILKTMHLDIYALAKIQIPKNNLYQYGAYLGLFNDIVNFHLGQRLKDAFITGLNINKYGLKIGYNLEYHYKSYNPAKFSHEAYVSFRLKKRVRVMQDTLSKPANLILAL